MGSGGGNGYKVKELLNAPAEYAFAVNDRNNINTDLMFNEELSNFDEIVITYDFKLQDGRFNHRHELRILIDNIIFNNSNTALMNGDRRTLILQDVAFHYFAGFWFKNANTMFVAFTTTNQDNSVYSALRFTSIKGIKY